ncbi:hypothetical protein ABW19_dt0202082 [Dactylella cylindrospora]|nr:hypothetical protein ABW19_dt0202082 [Dactylella cylindrospora]
MGPQRLRKTRNRTRDLDQISTDLRNPKRLQQHLSTLPLEDLPALGQHYCTPCAKFLESQHALAHHQRSKSHKKRVKLLKEPAYTHEEANAAVGRGTDNGIFKVNPDEVIKSVSRDRKIVEAATMSGEMDVEVEAEETPRLVEQEFDEDL